MARFYDMARRWKNGLKPIECFIVELFVADPSQNARNRERDMSRVVGDLNRALSLRGILESVGT